MPLQISLGLVVVTLLTLAVPVTLGWAVYRLIGRAVRSGVRDALSDRDIPTG
jgi:hypothetical protein